MWGDTFKLMLTSCVFPTNNSASFWYEAPLPKWVKHANLLLCLRHWTSLGCHHCIKKDILKWDSFSFYFTQDLAGCCPLAPVNSVITSHSNSQCVFLTEVPAKWTSLVRGIEKQAVSHAFLSSSHYSAMLTRKKIKKKEVIIGKPATAKYLGLFLWAL